MAKNGKLNMSVSILQINKQGCISMVTRQDLVTAFFLQTGVFSITLHNVSKISYCYVWHSLLNISLCSVSQPV